MIFGPSPSAKAKGAILAHSMKVGAETFKKGRLLSARDVESLIEANIAEVIVARLEAGDVGEDQAAKELALALCGAGLSLSQPFTGRVNLLAEGRGLLTFDRAGLDALNLIDEAVTVATLAPFELLEPRLLVATVKIIPFAVSRAVLDRCLTAAKSARLCLKPFMQKRVGLIQTILPGTKPSVLDKGRTAIDQRLAALGCAPSIEQRVSHKEAAVAAGLDELKDCDLLLLSGVSAIVDRQDVIPAAIVAAGGKVEHFGMPVDPGNLLLLATWQGKPVLGLPGCARSPKFNGFDWVLQRLIADLPVSGRDLMAMGAGGLLKEVAERGQPRSEGPDAKAPRAPKIAALVLAAGRSTRMGGPNKLLEELGGKILLRHAVEAALASQTRPVLVVTGHEHERVEAALAGLPVLLTHNPDYAAGLSTSLKRGLAALPDDVDGAVVLLGDMPKVAPALIDRLIAAFNPLEGRALIIPTVAGKRGNPLLFARRFFAEVQTIQGDQGARFLLANYPELVAEIEADDTVLIDVDTPEALARLTQQ